MDDKELERFLDFHDVEIDVIKLGDNIISGYPTGQINAPLPGGFSK